MSCLKNKFKFIHLGLFFVVIGMITPTSHATTVENTIGSINSVFRTEKNKVIFLSGKTSLVKKTARDCDIEVWSNGPHHLFGEVVTYSGLTKPDANRNRYRNDPAHSHFTVSRQGQAKQVQLSQGTIKVIKDETNLVAYGEDITFTYQASPTGMNLNNLISVTVTDSKGPQTCMIVR